MTAVSGSRSGIHLVLDITESAIRALESSPVHGLRSNSGFNIAITADVANSLSASNIPAEAETNEDENKSVNGKLIFEAIGDRLPIFSESTAISGPIGGFTENGFQNLTQPDMVTYKGERNLSDRQNSPFQATAVKSSSKDFPEQMVTSVSSPSQNENVGFTISAKSSHRSASSTLQQDTSRQNKDDQSIHMSQLASSDDNINHNVSKDLRNDILPKSAEIESGEEAGILNVSTTAGIVDEQQQYGARQLHHRSPSGLLTHSGAFLELRDNYPVTDDDSNILDASGFYITQHTDASQSLDKTGSNHRLGLTNGSQRLGETVDSKNVGISDDKKNADGSSSFEDMEPWIENRLKTRARKFGFLENYTDIIGHGDKSGVVDNYNSKFEYSSAEVAELIKKYTSPMVGGAILPEVLEDYTSQMPSLSHGCSFVDGQGLSKSIHVGSGLIDSGYVSQPVQTITALDRTGSSLVSSQSLSLTGSASYLSTHDDMNSEQVEEIITIHAPSPSDISLTLTEASTDDTASADVLPSKPFLAIKDRFFQSGGSDDQLYEGVSGTSKPTAVTVCRHVSNTSEPTSTHPESAEAPQRLTKTATDPAHPNAIASAAIAAVVATQTYMKSHNDLETKLQGIMNKLSVLEAAKTSLTGSDKSATTGSKIEELEQRIAELAQSRLNWLEDIQNKQQRLQADILAGPSTTHKDAVFHSMNSINAGSTQNHMNIHEFSPARNSLLVDRSHTYTPTLQIRPMRERSAGRKSPPTRGPSQRREMGEKSNFLRQVLATPDTRVQTSPAMQQSPARSPSAQRSPARYGRSGVGRAGSRSSQPSTRHPPLTKPAWKSPGGKAASSVRLSPGRARGRGSPFRGPGARTTNPVQQYALQRAGSPFHGSGRPDSPLQQSRSSTPSGRTSELVRPGSRPATPQGSGGASPAGKRSRSPSPTRSMSAYMRNRDGSLSPESRRRLEPAPIEKYLGRISPVRPTSPYPLFEKHDHSRMPALTLYAQAEVLLKNAYKTSNNFESNLSNILKSRQMSYLLDELDEATCDRSLAERMRIKKMVEEKIQALSKDVEVEVLEELVRSHISTQPTSSSAMPPGRGARQRYSIRQGQRGSVKGAVAPTQSKPTPAVREREGLELWMKKLAQEKENLPKKAKPYRRPRPLDPVLDEQLMNRVYGKALYHAQRNSQRDVCRRYNNSPLKAKLARAPPINLQPTKLTGVEMATAKTQTHSSPQRKVTEKKQGMAVALWLPRQENRLKSPSPTRHTAKRFVVDANKQEDGSEADIIEELVHDDTTIVLPGHAPPPPSVRARTSTPPLPGSDSVAEDQHREDLLRNRAVEWIENELMARIINDMHSARDRLTQPVEARTSTAQPLNEAMVESLVLEALRERLRSMRGAQKLQPSAIILKADAAVCTDIEPALVRADVGVDTADIPQLVQVVKLPVVLREKTPPPPIIADEEDFPSYDGMSDEEPIKQTTPVKRPILRDAATNTLNDASTNTSPPPPPSPPPMLAPQPVTAAPPPRVKTPPTARTPSPPAIEEPKVLTPPPVVKPSPKLIPVTPREEPIEEILQPQLMTVPAPSLTPPRSQSIDHSEAEESLAPPTDDSSTNNECVSEGQWLISLMSDGEIGGDLDEGLRQRVRHHLIQAGQVHHRHVSGSAAEDDDDTDAGADALPSEGEQVLPLVSTAEHRIVFDAIRHPGAEQLGHAHLPGSSQGHSPGFYIESMEYPWVTPRSGEGGDVYRESLDYSKIPRASQGYQVADGSGISRATQGYPGNFRDFSRIPRPVEDRKQSGSSVEQSIGEVAESRSAGQVGVHRPINWERLSAGLVPPWERGGRNNKSGGGVGQKQGGISGKSSAESDGMIVGESESRRNENDEPQITGERPPNQSLNDTTPPRERGDRPTSPLGKTRYVEKPVALRVKGRGSENVDELGRGSSRSSTGEVDSLGNTLSSGEGRARKPKKSSLRKSQTDSMQDAIQAVGQREAETGVPKVRSYLDLYSPISTTTQTGPTSPDIRQSLRDTLNDANIRSMSPDPSLVHSRDPINQSQELLQSEPARDLQSTFTLRGQPKVNLRDRAHETETARPQEEAEINQGSSKYNSGVDNYEKDDDNDLYNFNDNYDYGDQSINQFNYDDEYNSDIKQYGQFDEDAEQYGQYYEDAEQHNDEIERSPGEEVRDRERVGSPSSDDDDFS